MIKDNDTSMQMVAFVTGSTKGIGFSIIKALLSKGITVIGNSRGQESTLPQEFQLLLESNAYLDYYAGDLSKEDIVENIFRKVTKKYGRIDILVNNIGNSNKKPFLRMTPDDFKKALDVNLLCSVYCSKHAIRSMVQQKFGRIINISSIAGTNGMSFEAHYSAAKAGLIGLTKSIAREYGSMGITCNAVAPGIINIGNSIEKGLAETKVLELIPVNRFGSPEDVAEIVLFLSSEKAGYINGQVIKVDGGLYI